MSEALEDLRVAVEQFAVEAHANMCEDQGMVTQAIVVYETVCFDDEGQPARVISYAIPTDNFSLSGGLGLIEAARFYIRRDALGSAEDTE